MNKMESIGYNLHRNEVEPLREKFIFIKSGITTLEPPLQKAREVVRKSNVSCEQYQNTIFRMLDTATDIDKDSYLSAVKELSKVVINQLSNSSIGLKESTMNGKIEKVLVEKFSTKPDVLQIIKSEVDEQDYWLIVEDSLSETTLEYNNIYFEILKNVDVYFDFKVLDMLDLETLHHIDKNTIWRKDGI